MVPWRARSKLMTRRLQAFHQDLGNAAPIPTDIDDHSFLVELGINQVSKATRPAVIMSGMWR